MIQNTKKSRPVKRDEAVYGSYEKYNFFQIYRQHDPLHVKVTTKELIWFQDIEGAAPRVDIKSTLNQMTTSDIKGAQPRKMFGVR